MTPTADTDTNTRQKLIVTAMRLFAEQGVGAVSMRTINSESGTKNSGAAHYYFGNKQGIISAIVEYITMMSEKHLTESNLLVVKKAVANQSMSLQEILRESLLPTLKLPKQFPWGQHAIKFMSRLMLEEDPQIQEILNLHSKPGLAQLLDILTAALPTVAKNILKLRLMFVMANVIHGIAEMNNLKNTPLGRLTFSVADLIEHLLDYLEAGLAAPISVYKK